MKDLDEKEVSSFIYNKDFVDIFGGKDVHG